MKAGADIKTAKTLPEVVRIHTQDFEKPAKWEELLDKRLSNAENVFERMTTPKVLVAAPPKEPEKPIMPALSARPGAALAANGLTGRPGEKIKTEMPVFKLITNVKAAHDTLSQADRSPLSIMNSQAIANSSSTQRITRGDTNISVGPVAVHTQAMDADGISKTISDHLGAHLRNALDQSDDGIAA